MSFVITFSLNSISALQCVWWQCIVTFPHSSIKSVPTIIPIKYWWGVQRWITCKYMADAIVNRDIIMISCRIRWPVIKWLVWWNVTWWCEGELFSVKKRKHNYRDRIQWGKWLYKLLPNPTTWGGQCHPKRMPQRSGRTWSEGRWIHWLWNPPSCWLCTSWRLVGGATSALRCSVWWCHLHGSIWL